MGPGFLRRNIAKGALRYKSHYPGEWKVRRDLNMGELQGVKDK